VSNSLADAMQGFVERSGWRIATTLRELQAPEYRTGPGFRVRCLLLTPEQWEAYCDYLDSESFPGRCDEQRRTGHGLHFMSFPCVRRST
jgi:hypothetical protein